MIQNYLHRSFCLKPQCIAALGATLLVLGFHSAKGADSASLTNADKFQAPGIRFRWAVGAFEGADGRIIPIRDNVTLSTNAAVAMMVKPESPCYVYVLVETGDGEYEWHFPGNSPGDVEEFHKQTAYYIPPPPMGLRFVSTNGANTKIHVLASGERLKELESRFAKYQTASSNEKDLCASDLTALLDQLEKRQGAKPPPNSSDDLALRAGSPEGGADLDSFASEITAQNFFEQMIILRTP